MKGWDGRSDGGKDRADGEVEVRLVDGDGYDIVLVDLGCILLALSVIILHSIPFKLAIVLYPFIFFIKMHPLILHQR